MPSGYHLLNESLQQRRHSLRQLLSVRRHNLRHRLLPDFAPIDHGHGRPLHRLERLPRSPLHRGPFLQLPLVGLYTSIVLRDRPAHLVQRGLHVGVEPAVRGEPKVEID